MVQGLDGNGRSYGWTADAEDGPYGILTEFSEAYEGLNIPTEEEMNPETEFMQIEKFSDCNGNLMVSVPSVHDGNYDLCSQRSCLSRTGAH